MSIKFWDKKKKIKLDEKGDKPEKHIPLRKYTKGGKKSTVMGLISLLIIVLAVAISIALKGKAGVYVGLMVFVSLIVSAWGFAVGLKSFSGTIGNAVIWIFILGLYLIYV